jgi:hypothetical protein
VVEVALRQDRGAVAGGQSRLAVALDALGVGTVQGQAGEELGRHAAAAAGVEVAHFVQAPPVCGLRSSANSSLCCQTRWKPPSSRTLPGQEVLVDGEGAGVDVADRIDQADHPAGAAQVEPGRASPSADRWKNESPVSTASPWRQPVVELALLRRRGVCSSSQTSAPAPTGAAGDPQLGAVAVGDALNSSSWSAFCR